MTTLEKRLLLLGRVPQPIVGLLKIMLILLIVGGALFALDRIQRDTVLTLDQTRPIITAAAILLTVAGLWGSMSTIRILRGHPREFAWRMAFRVVGWLGLAGSAAGIILLLLSKEGSSPHGFPVTGALRAVEFILPLVVGIQAAFLFSPDDEPGMEVLLACPRPVSWVLLERLVLLAALQTAIGLVGMIASMVVTGSGDVLVAFLRWISPALFFGGVGVYVTIRSRQPAFGVAIVGLIWFMFAFIGTTMLPGMPTFWPMNLVQPFIWSIYGYLRPTDLAMGDYLLNRVVLAGLGLLLVMMAARQLKDEEGVLLGGRSKKTG